MKKIFNSKTYTSQKAFTLIELLIVIAVLGILAAAIITAINPVKRINEAKDSNVKSDMSQIVNGLQAYFVSQNPPVYPDTLAGLQTSGDLKTVPKQQAGNKGCITAPGTDTTDYCYTGGTGPVIIVVWGRLFQATGFWCWDSTNAVFKISTSAVVGQTTCP